MIMIEKCPYKCRMFWYVAVWGFHCQYARKAFVFDTKKEAVKKAKELESNNPKVTYNVSWIEDSMKRHTRFSLKSVIGDFEVIYHGTKLA